MDYLIVGLGNPGKQYENTRHNVGWILLDKIARECGVKIKKIKFKSTYCEAEIAGKKVILMKPQTFMNLSGQSVFEAARYYDVPVSNIIVLCDDTALPFNKLRIRRSGSAGGHNGLKNIIYLLESDQFPRIRFGVSDKPNGADLADWVLGSFSAKECKTIEERSNDVYDAVKLIVEKNIDAAMAKYN
ncbi:MAG: aminoacyl-tRNA hydrolase [Clostridiales bacterium]|nr:MAG: aminoacyl-tRNA hydrolase [Clostridiales bacterium]